MEVVQVACVSEFVFFTISIYVAANFSEWLWVKKNEEQQIYKNFYRCHFEPETEKYNLTMKIGM